MVILVRVDDRLLHGQIICSWVPFCKADSLVVASDEAASDSLATEIIKSCGCKGLTVHVERIEDALDCIEGGPCATDRVILIIGDLRDAMRVYRSGVRFTSLNLGNIHHGEGEGRKVSPYVILDEEDERIIEEFEEMGVRVEIRDVPSSSAVEYVSGKRKIC